MPIHDFVRARYRLPADFNIVLVIAFLALALLSMMAIVEKPHDVENYSVLAILLAMAGATPFYYLVGRARGVIEFDATGARWRTAFGRWKSARWDEIESAHIRAVSTKHRKFVIATPNGQFSWTNAFENADKLAPLAARFCARVLAQTGDWTHRFNSGNGETWLFVLALSLCAVYLIWLLQMLVAAGAPLVWLGDYAALYGWPLTLIGFVSFALLVAAIPLVFALLSFRLALSYWHFRDQALEATPRGLSWHKAGRQRLFAAWDELQTLHIEARGPLIALPHYRLQSARGEFELANGLSNNTAFWRLLAERAPQIERVVPARLNEALSAAPDANGAILRFYFKTREWRSMLGLCGFVSLFGWGMVVFGPIQPSDGSAPAPTWLTCIAATLMTAMTLYGVELFRRGVITLDERGIRWDLPLRQRFVAWEEIEDLRREKGLFLIVGARKISLPSAPVSPAHIERLYEEVEARALNVEGGWKGV